MTAMKKSFQFSGLEIAKLSNAARCYNLRHGLHIKDESIKKLSMSNFNF